MAIVNEQPVTLVDVERTRRILLEQEAWNQTLGDAYQARIAAGMFASWSEGHEWLAAQPKLPPTQLERLAFDLRERRVSGRKTVRRSLAVPKPPRRPKRTEPVIPPDRQLEIAIAALEARERREAAQGAAKGHAA